MRALWSLLVLLSALHAAISAKSITDFGAVPNAISDEAAAANVAALQGAFAAANASGNTDRTVLVPFGNFTILNVTLNSLVDVTFQIEGTILLSTNRSAWPPVWNDGGNWGALQFEQASGLTIVGTGPKVQVDGQGYDWWWHVITTGQDVRPHMFVFYQCVYLQVMNLSVVNSPQFHFYVSDVAHVYFKNVSIVVDAIQKDLPIFPLNTDGIDPSGINITIEDSYIENYDDAVAVKVKFFTLSCVTHCPLRLRLGSLVTEPARRTSS